MKQEQNRKSEIHKEPHLRLLEGWAPKEALPAGTDSRADLEVEWTGGNDGPERKVLDLVITHPIVANAPECARGEGAAATAAHSTKLAKYKKTWSFPKSEFVPLALETGGRMHPDFRKLLRWFVRQPLGPDAAKWSPEEKAKYSRDLQSLITAVSVAVTRSTSHALLRLKEACDAAPGAVNASQVVPALPAAAVAAGEGDANDAAGAAAGGAAGAATGGE